MPTKGTASAVLHASVASFGSAIKGIEHAMAKTCSAHPQS
jgi:hypothetical protein